MLTLARSQTEAGETACVLTGSDLLDGDRPLTETRVGELTVWRMRRPERSVQYALAGEWREASSILATHLSSLQPRIVHLHHWHNLASNVVSACSRSGIPVVVTLHDLFATCPLFFRLPPGSLDLCPPDQPLSACARCVADVGGLDIDTATAGFRRRIERFRDELDRAGAVLTLSVEQQRYMSRIPALEGLNIEALPLPPATIPARIDRDELRERDDGLRIVSWGGLVPGKGMGTLVAACASMQRRERVSVHHYGRILDQAFKERLLAEARGFELCFEGPYEETTAETRFASYDLAVFPSLYLETHGFVVDEALSLGLPVIVSDRGAPPSRVGRRGRVFRAGDVGELAGLLDELVTDRGQLAAMRAGSHPRSPTFEEHRAAVDAVYRQATSGGAGSC